MGGSNRTKGQKRHARRLCQGGKWNRSGAPGVSGSAMIRRAQVGFAQPSRPRTLGFSPVFKLGDYRPSRRPAVGITTCPPSAGMPCAMIIDGLGASAGGCGSGRNARRAHVRLTPRSLPRTWGETSGRRKAFTGRTRGSVVGSSGISLATAPDPTCGRGRSPDQPVEDTAHDQCPDHQLRPGRPVINFVGRALVIG